MIVATAAMPSNRVKKCTDGYTAKCPSNHRIALTCADPH